MEKDVFRKISMQEFNQMIKIKGCINDRGSQGYVFIVKYDKDFVALKFFKQDQLPKYVHAQAQNTRRMSSSGSNQNIAKFIAAYTFYNHEEKKNQYCILTECYAQNLDQSLQNQIYSTEEKFHLCKQIVSGIMAIHGEKIIHRDIKPANIMIQGKNAKIIDFGISKRVENSVIITKRIGTIGYADKEMFDNDSHYQYEVDIYSAGLVITEIFVRQNYFTKLAQSQDRDSVIKRQKQFQLDVKGEATKFLTPYKLEPIVFQFLINIAIWTLQKRQKRLNAQKLYQQIDRYIKKCFEDNEENEISSKDLTKEKLKPNLNRGKVQSEITQASSYKQQNSLQHSNEDQKSNSEENIPNKVNQSPKCLSYQTKQKINSQIIQTRLPQLKHEYEDLNETQILCAKTITLQSINRSKYQQMNNLKKTIQMIRKNKASLLELRKICESFLVNVTDYHKKLIFVVALYFYFSGIYLQVPYELRSISKQSSFYMQSSIKSSCSSSFLLDQTKDNSRLQSSQIKSQKNIIAKLYAQEIQSKYKLMHTFATDLYSKKPLLKPPILSDSIMSKLIEYIKCSKQQFKVNIEALKETFDYFNGYMEQLNIQVKQINSVKSLRKSMIIVAELFQSTNFVPD